MGVEAHFPMNIPPKTDEREPESFMDQVLTVVKTLAAWLRGLGGQVRGVGRRAWSRTFGRDSQKRSGGLLAGITSQVVRVYVAPEPMGLRQLRRMHRASHLGGGSDDAHSAAA